MNHINKTMTEKFKTIITSSIRKWYGLPTVISNYIIWEILGTDLKRMIANRQHLIDANL